VSVLHPRARLLAVALTTGAVAALAALSFTPSATAGGQLPTTPTSSAPIVPSEPPSPEPTASESPDVPAEECVAEAASPEDPIMQTVALVNNNEVLCKFKRSQDTISWDGAVLKIVPAPNPRFGSGFTCVLDPKSVKVLQPGNATVKQDGSVEVPYDKTKKEKITIVITYEINCSAPGFTVAPLKEKLTIEFTPPDGPLSTTYEKLN
jgi:hypothetical protein